MSLDKLIKTIQTEIKSQKDLKIFNKNQRDLKILTTFKKKERNLLIKSSTKTHKISFQRLT